MDEGTFGAPSAVEDKMTINVRPSDVMEKVDPGMVEAASPKARRGVRYFLFRLAILVALVFAAWKGYDYAMVGRFIVSTDDAYVRADMSVIAAKISGYVSEVMVKDNTPVKAGDLLVRIDDGDYKNALDSAEARFRTQQATVARFTEQMSAQKAAIDQAQAQVVSVKADIVRTQAEFDRATSLAKQDFGSQQRVDLTRSDRDKSIAALASANASVEAARGMLSVYEAQRNEAQQQLGEIRTTIDKAQRDLSFTQITAAFDGVVGNRAAQPGQYVQPGTRLLALVPLQSVYVDANLKETQLANIRIGQKADITIDAQAGRRVEGVVESFSPATGSMFSLLPPENATGNFTKIVQRIPVRIRLPAEVIAEGKLRPGLSVVVDIDTKKSETARNPDNSTGSAKE